MDLVAVMAADAQCDPSYLEKMCDVLIDEKLDYVKANRYNNLDALRAMLSRIAEGERVLPPPAALAFIAESLRQPGGSQAAPTAQLTSREGQVLECFARGLSRPDVAALLGISQATLRTHVQNILAKLQLHSIQQAASLIRSSEPPPSPDA